MSWHELKGSSDKANSLIHKLHHRPEFEFYDLKNDPHEMRNEIKNPEYQSMVEKMKKALMQKLNDLGDTDPIATEKSLVKTGGAKNKGGKGKRKKNQ